MTRPPSLIAFVVLAGTACTRDVLAPFVPKVEVRGELTRAGAASAQLHADERVHAGFSVFLKWQAPILVRNVLVPLELAPASWLAPCALDDATCLGEVLEVERELGADLEAP